MATCIGLNGTIHAEGLGVPWYSRCPLGKPSRVHHGSAYTQNVPGTPASHSTAHCPRRLERAALTEVPFLPATPIRPAQLSLRGLPTAPRRRHCSSRADSFPDPARRQVSHGQGHPTGRTGQGPTKTQRRLRRRGSVTPRPRPHGRGTSPGAGLRVDDTRRGGAESLVPWSGASEPHSGGAESEEGKRALSPDLAPCGGSVPVGQGTGVSAEGEAAAPSLSPARR